VTFRHRGHVGPKEDIDVGVRRRESDVVKWKRLDPIVRLRRTLLDSGRAEKSALDALTASIRQEVEEAAGRAERAPYPQPSALLDLVYVGGVA
jgi:pyruvate dehydrogenase E1 component alpha subunit